MQISLKVREYTTGGHSLAYGVSYLYLFDILLINMARYIYAGQQLNRLRTLGISQNGK